MRKQRKAMSRMTVAELKQVVARPICRGARRHGLGPAVAGLPEVLPEYGTGPEALVPQAQVFTGETGRGKKTVPAACEYIAQTGPRTSVVYSCAPTPSARRAFRSCVCAMAWRFHAIDATSAPWPRRLEGVGG